MNREQVSKALIETVDQRDREGLDNLLKVELPKVFLSLIDHPNLQTLERSRLRLIPKVEKWWPSIEEFHHKDEVYAIAEALNPELKPYQHTEDFRVVYWKGDKFEFNPTQAIAIRLLWKAWENDLTISETTIAESINTIQTHYKLHNTFRHKGKYHPAWDKMIKHMGKGIHTLKTLENV